MTRLRSHSPLLLLPLLAIPGCRSDAVFRRPNQQGYSFDPVRKPLGEFGEGIDLFTSQGSILVSASDEATLTKSLTICALNREGAEKIRRGCKVEMSRSAKDHLVLSIDPGFGANLDRICADLSLELPPSRELELLTKVGRIDTVDYEARNLDLRTIHGAIRVGSCEESLRYRSETGSVEILASFAKAEGQTQSGKLDARILRPNASLRHRTVSGSTTLRIPEGLAATIEFHTRHGRILAEIPVTRTRIDKGRKEPGSSGYASWRIYVGHDGKKALGASGFRAVIRSESGDLRLLPDFALPTRRGPEAGRASADRTSSRSGARGPRLSG